MHEMEEVNWTKIFSSTLPHEIDILQGMLAEAGIESVIINKKDSSYLFGDIELYVNATDAFLAQQLINQNIS